MRHIIAHPIFFVQKPGDFCEELTKKQVPTRSDICFMSLPDTYQPCVREISQPAKWQEQNLHPHGGILGLRPVWDDGL